jgi:hypothetical protein
MINTGTSDRLDMAKIEPQSVAALGSEYVLIASETGKVGVLQIDQRPHKVVPGPVKGKDRILAKA